MHVKIVPLLLPPLLPPLLQLLPLRVRVGSVGSVEAEGLGSQQDEAVLVQVNNEWIVARDDSVQPHMELPFSQQQRGDVLRVGGPTQCSASNSHNNAWQDLYIICSFVHLFVCSFVR